MRGVPPNKIVNISSQKQGTAQNGSAEKAMCIGVWFNKIAMENGPFVIMADSSHHKNSDGP